MGKIGKALQAVRIEGTRLQQEVGRLVRRVAAAGLSLCAAVVVLYGLGRGDWLHGFLAGITLAIAMLPEEFPVVLTIFLALGAWRLVLYVPVLRDLFHFSTLHADDLALCLGGGVLSILWFEGVKVFRRTWPAA